MLTVTKTLQTRIRKEEMKISKIIILKEKNCQAI